MSKKIRVFLFLTPFLCGLAAIAFFSQQNQTVKAELHESFVTLDVEELKQIRQAAQKINRPLNLNVLRVENGIAIVKATEDQINQLSQHSHEEFHKCGGFISHESETEALQTIENFVRADANRVMVDYTINNNATVTQLMAGMQASNIVTTINGLSAFNTRYHLAATGQQSANWIKDQWTALAAGRSDVTVQLVQHAPTVSPQPSIVLTIQGTSEPNEYVIMGAHQDSTRSGCTSTSTCQTLPAPGADDDASGIASLTEVIRMAMASNYRPAKTVQFMAYAAEEVGLRGSNAIATDYRTRNVNVLGVLQLDMTNYKGSTTTDIAIFTDFTNAAQNQFLRDLITAYLPTMQVTNSVCGYGCSDHASWHNKQYPASFPHESPFNVSNPNIHKATDTLSVSDTTGNHALKFSKLAAAFMAELAKGSLTTTPSPSNKRADFDGDGRSDVSVFRAENGAWYLDRSSAGFTGTSWGVSSDILTPEDFDGDGKTDIGVFRGGSWYVLRSSNNSLFATQFGAANDIPVAGDFDSDGRADTAVFRQGNWYIMNSSNNQFRGEQFGAATDKPIIGDFDGDGKNDLAVFRDGVWYAQRSSAGFFGEQFGLPTDKPVAADYDGDGKDDLAVFRPENGGWYIRKSTGGVASVQWGISTDVPVPGDYDGDGKYDVGVYRGGAWYWLKSSNNAFQGYSFGSSNDKPIPNSYLPQN